MNFRQFFQKKKAPVNTERQAIEHPNKQLLDMMGNPNAIPAQEAQGQQSFTESDTLPTDIRCSDDYDAEAILKAAGVKFLGPVEDDPMFQYVELPQGGWKKVATDHSMRSKLLDQKGRERASIFYKAAFYDRRAHMSLSCRFSISFDYDRFDKENVGVANIMDCGKVIQITEPIAIVDNDKRWDVSDKARKLAVEWLNKNYPNWQNPGAYWDC